MSEVDYPAAHSMDSCWFAVDLDGNVAMFDTGEGGALPVGDYPLGGEAGGYEDDAMEGGLLLAAALLTLARDDAELAALLPGNEDTLFEVVESGFWEMDLEGARLLQAAGVFFYDCDEGYAAPYARSGPVPTPIPLDRLPDRVRARFGEKRLPVRFAQDAWVQPGEHGPVESWTQVWVDRQGEVHPTDGGSAKDVEQLRAEIPDVWSPRELEGQPPLDRAAFLEAVEELIGAGRGELERSATAHVRAKEAKERSDAEVDWPKTTGFLGWLKKLFGG